MDDIRKALSSLDSIEAPDLWGEIQRRAATPEPSQQRGTGGRQSVFSATKFVVAGAIVALFGGFLLAGILGIRPDEAGPATSTPLSEPYVLPSKLPDDLESGVLETPVGPARWVRVKDAPANPSLMESVATDDGFAVLDHWSNRLWHSPDLLSWTELPMPAEAEYGGILDRAAGSYWLDGGASGEVALWRSSDLDEWNRIDTAALSPGGPEGLFRPLRLGRLVESGESVLVPVHYHESSLDLASHLGLPAEPDGESYDFGGGGWVFESVEPGVYRVLTTSSDVDTMPSIRFEEIPGGLRVIDAVDESVLRELPGIDRESMETLLAAFAETVTGSRADQRRYAQLRDWALQRGIVSWQLAIVDGDRLVPLDATARPDASLELFDAGADVVLLEFRDDGRVGVRRSRDGMEWEPSILATDAAGEYVETHDWLVGPDDIEVLDEDGRLLRSRDGVTWMVSEMPSQLQEPSFGEVMWGRLGGAVVSLSEDNGSAETLHLHTADGERVDVDLRPLGIGTSFDDGEGFAYGRVLSDRTVALGFGSPPGRGMGDYVIISFYELGQVDAPLVAPHQRS